MLLQRPFTHFTSRARSDALQLTRPCSKCGAWPSALGGNRESIICCREVKGVHGLHRFLYWCHQSYTANAQPVPSSKTQECTSVRTRLRSYNLNACTTNLAPQTSLTVLLQTLNMWFYLLFIFKLGEEIKYSYRNVSSLCEPTSFRSKEWASWLILNQHASRLLIQGNVLRKYLGWRECFTFYLGI